MTTANQPTPTNATTAPARGLALLVAWWQAPCWALVGLMIAVHLFIPSWQNAAVYAPGIVAAVALFVIPLISPYGFQRFLTRLALAFLTIFVVIPAGNVFKEAMQNGWNSYTAVFFPPPVDTARLAAIEKRLAEIDAMSLRQRRESRDEQRALQREEGEIKAPADRAKKNWSAVRMTLGVAAVVVPLNMAFGLAAAWAVTKFRFRGRALLVSVIDLPFSVSPVIAGLVFVLLFGAQGYLEQWWTRSSRVPLVVFLILPAALIGCWVVIGIGRVMTRAVRWAARVANVELRSPAKRGVLGVGWVYLAIVAVTFTLVSVMGWFEFPWRRLAPSTWRWPDPMSLYWRGFSGGQWWPVGAGNWFEGVIFTPVAIVMASVFVTFPFVARSLIPLMEVQGVEAEQAALTLGASGRYTFRRVTLPGIKWALLYGAILCSARALGEFGAVSVVSGHLDSNDTMPLRVEKLWQSSRTQAAFTVASMLAMLAVVTLILKGIIEWKTKRDRADGEDGPAAKVRPGHKL